jgi:hypothetical protein
MANGLAMMRLAFMPGAPMETRYGAAPPRRAARSRRRKRRHAADVDLAQHEALGAIGRRLAEHEVAVPQQRQPFARQPDPLAQQRDPARLQLLPQRLEARQFWAVVQARPGHGCIGVQRVDGLVAEAGDAVLDQIGAHHAFGQPRLPGLVQHVAAGGGLEVRRQRGLQRRHVHALRRAAALGVLHRQHAFAGLLDAPHADAAVAAVLLEHAAHLPQALGQLGHQLRQAVDAVHVAAERQVAGLEQHVLGAQALDGIWVRADDHAACATSRSRASSRSRRRPSSIGLHHARTSCTVRSWSLTSSAKSSCHTAGWRPRRRRQKASKSAAKRLAAGSARSRAARSPG